MSWVTELAIAGLCGVLTPFVLVVFAGLLSDRSPRAQALVDFGKQLAATAWYRGLLVEREHGGYTFIATSFDSRFGSERGTLDGETKDWYDTHGLMTELYGMPFGIVHEGFNTILNPPTADMAREFLDAKKEDSLVVTDGGTNYYRAIVELDAGERPALSLTDATKIIQGSSDPGATYRKDRFQELSQAVWNKVPAIDYLIWLISLGAGFGIVYIGVKLAETLNSSGGGDSTVNQPLSIAVDTMVMLA